MVGFTKLLISLPKHKIAPQTHLGLHALLGGLGLAVGARLAGALLSGGWRLAGILKAIEDRAEGGQQEP